MIFSVHVVCGVVSFFLDDDVIYTSGFVDDVAFSHDGSYSVCH